ncbi:MAG: sn-glycerol-3-phosphate ABC transporter ATP-binding protein UgpC [bacterium]|nr:sn-glycerol-3-phosphate ABC transporter ATP-binding protein UgpC [bacterium]
MASVELKKVSKQFSKGVKALVDIDIEIEDGEFLVMVGPSGCGKSTALRIIAGLEEADSGTVYIDSRDVTHIPPKDRDIAMVFQNYALYPHMKVFDNLGFGLKLRKYNKDEIRTRVNEAAQILDIKHLLDRKPKELSGGQRQRVALGRAIVRKPSVFLFDEPLSNLDARLRVQMRSEIKKLHQKLGTTMVYVTHDQVEAMTMGDRIVVLKDGMIHQIDKPLRLYDDPADVFVGGFIGSPSMNFIKLDIKDDRAVYENNTILDFSDDLIRKIKKMKITTFLLGIRPEHIYLEKTDKSIPIDVKLDLVEPMGSEVYVYLLFGSERIILKTNKYLTLDPDRSMLVYIDIEKSLFFDHNSEKRILSD